MIEIYTDETFCNKNTFSLHAVIWGMQDNCMKYKGDIQQIVESNRGVLGRDFKEFHASKLKKKNWNTIGQVYLEVLETLFKYLHNGQLHLLISIESMEKYRKNAGVLKNEIRMVLENRQGEIGQLFSSLDKQDLPALYHRIDQLMIFFRYRDNFGDENEVYTFCPDASGKIMIYEEKKYQMSVGSISYPLPFFTLVKVMTNFLIKSSRLRVQGWSTKNQRIDEFKPLNSENDYLIQTCDIISNFYYNYLRTQVGINKDICRLKSDVLSDNIDLSGHESEITNSFSLEDQEVVCISDELKAKVEVKVTLNQHGHVT